MHPSNNSGRSGLASDVQEPAAVEQKTADGIQKLFNQIRVSSVGIELRLLNLSGELSVLPLSCLVTLTLSEVEDREHSLVRFHRITYVVLQVHLAISQVGLSTATGKRVACPVTDSSAAHCCLRGRSRPSSAHAVGDEKLYSRQQHPIHNPAIRIGSRRMTSVHVCANAWQLRDRRRRSVSMLT